MKYVLMHKNEACARLAFEEETGRLIDYQDAGNGLTPYLGHSDWKKMRKWWEMRAVPASRNMMKDMIRRAGCLNSEMYLVKNLALSMTDTYWIRPEGSELTFDDVKLTNLAARGVEKVPYHNITSYDPNASLGGQMEKFWDLSGEKPLLVKESYRYFGQQAVNEVFATELHRRQAVEIPFVEYSATASEDHGIWCICEAFTSEKTELIPAFEVLDSRKHRNECSLYEEYIEICVEHGIERECMQKFMDYQTMTDFLISNTDEHLLNFGVLRDTDTMRLIEPAPIFDSGNSMFFSDSRQIPYTRAGILELPITSFYKSEEKMLAKVKDRSLVKTDLLPDPRETKEWYMDAGIPEKKAELISKNYETKLQLFQEFQNGKKISLYKEKQEEKKKDSQAQKNQKQKFILVYGVDGIGRSVAEKLYQTFAEKGYPKKNSEGLYQVSKLTENSGLVLNVGRMMEEIAPVEGYKGSVVWISIKDIREEIAEIEPLYRLESLVNVLIEARLKAAFLSGATVICDIDQWERKKREKYVGLAEEAGVKERIFCRARTHSAEYEIDQGTDVSMVREEVMKYEASGENVEDEGWTEIKSLDVDCE